MAKNETDSADAAQAAATEIKELKQIVVILERACRQTLVFMSGSSCLDESRIKNIINQAVRDSSKITNPKQ